MSNAIQPFAFEDHLVRTITDDGGEPWFVAKDVALALGYQWVGIRNIQHVPEEWRRVESVSTLRRGEQEMHLLSEQGLNFFVLRSDKPAALPFQRWLAGEVLPALRRTGRYALPEQDADLESAMSGLGSRERLNCLRMATQIVLAGKGMAELKSIFGQICELVRPQKDMSDVTALMSCWRPLWTSAARLSGAIALRAASCTTPSSTGARPGPLPTASSDLGPRVHAAHPYPS